LLSIADLGVNHLITLSALASTFRGILAIFDFGFSIFD
jgi:hypothetical protein